MICGWEAESSKVVGNSSCKISTIQQATMVLFLKAVVILLRICLKSMRPQECGLPRAYISDMHVWYTCAKRCKPKLKNASKLSAKLALSAWASILGRRHACLCLSCLQSKRLEVDEYVHTHTCIHYMHTAHAYITCLHYMHAYTHTCIHTYIHVETLVFHLHDIYFYICT